MCCNTTELRHIFRFRWACPRGDNWRATTNRAQNQAAERDGHHDVGGMPRPHHERASHLDLCRRSRQFAECFGLGNVPVRWHVLGSTDSGVIARIPGVALAAVRRS